MRGGERGSMLKGSECVWDDGYNGGGGEGKRSREGRDRLLLNAMIPSKDGRQV